MLQIYNNFVKYLYKIGCIFDIFSFYSRNTYYVANNVNIGLCTIAQRCILVSIPIEI